MIAIWRLWLSAKKLIPNGPTQKNLQSSEFSGDELQLEVLVNLNLEKLKIVELDQDGSMKRIPIS